jgi:condensin complex subunit 3
MVLLLVLSILQTQCFNLLFIYRKNLDKLIHDLLLSEHVGHRFVENLLEQLCRIHTDSAARVQNLVEVIEDIRAPISTVETSLTQDQKQLVEVKVTMRFMDQFD